jgi:hypothetical protein
MQMATSRDDDLESIETRNRIRAVAGLPLLDVEAESKRLDAVRGQAEFEREWERRRDEFAHQWSRNTDGWLTNMARVSIARRRVRLEMQNRQDAKR